jgi:hypothetical protein
MTELFLKNYLFTLIPFIMVRSLLPCALRNNRNEERTSSHD